MTCAPHSQSSTQNRLIAQSKFETARNYLQPLNHPMGRPPTSRRAALPCRQGVLALRRQRVGQAATGAGLSSGVQTTASNGAPTWRQQRRRRLTQTSSLMTTRAASEERGAPLKGYRSALAVHKALIDKKTPMSKGTIAPRCADKPPPATPPQRIRVEATRPTAPADGPETPTNNEAAAPEGATASIDGSGGMLGSAREFPHSGGCVERRKAHMRGWTSASWGTITSEPRGSFTTALRSSSKSVRKRSKRSSSGPVPESGPPDTRIRVGSPSVWESMTSMVWMASQNHFESWAAALARSARFLGQRCAAWIAALRTAGRSAWDPGPAGIVVRQAQAYEAPAWGGFGLEVFARTPRTRAGPGAAPHCMKRSRNSSARGSSLPFI